MLLPAAPLLACVKPAASVHPEPGSNSSLYKFFIILSLILLTVQSLSFKKLTLLEFLICYRFLFRYLLVLVLTSLVNDLFSFSAMSVFERRGLQRYELFRILQIFLQVF